MKNKIPAVQNSLTVLLNAVDALQDCDTLETHARVIAAAVAELKRRNWGRLECKTHVVMYYNSIKHRTRSAIVDSAVKAVYGPAPAEKAAQC